MTDFTTPGIGLRIIRDVSIGTFERGEVKRRFPLNSRCITLTGMIGCRAAAEAGSTDTFNAVPLYLVHKFIETQGEGERRRP